jgi:hypothetical protein
MGRKHIIKQFQVFEAQAVTGTNSYDSTVTDVEQVDRVTYSIFWTSSPVGTIQVQVSDDQSNWQVLQFGSTINIDGTETDHRIEINQVNFKFCKLVYTNTSGSGVLNAFIHGATEGA